MTRISSILAWRSTIAHVEFQRGTGMAAAVAGIALFGAVSMMDALLVEWRDARIPVRTAATITVPPPRLEKPKDVRILASVAMVKDVFSSTGYSLDAVRRDQVAVPRLLYVSLPHDMKEVTLAAERKALFLRFMLPYVLHANKRVRDQREKLLALRPAIESGEPLQPADQIWLDAVYEEYSVKPGKIASLIARVDTVPPSLALAQSAVESGWGTSRFAQEGNAPFGQWTTAAYRGIVPKERGDGKTHKIRAFNDLNEAVESYLRNLNTHRAYREFRQRRAALRAQEVSVDSVAIAGTLTSYSQEGDAYVALVRRVIQENDLRALDEARLGAPAAPIEPGA